MARKSSRSSTSSSNSLRCLVGVMLAVVGLWILGAFVLFPVDEHLYPHRHSSMSSRFSATTQTVDKPALDDGAVSPFQGQSGDQQSNKGSGPRGKYLPLLHSELYGNGDIHLVLLAFPFFVFFPMIL